VSPHGEHPVGSGSGATARASACGKVILLGEHAVVYGVPAVAVGIERGVRATSRVLPGGPSRLAVRAWGVDVSADDAHDLGRARRAVMDASDGARPVAIEAEVELPPGGGLGCSAALGVAVARAIDARSEGHDLERRVMAWERVFHGNPSGVDAAVASRGGCIVFTKGEAGAEPRIESVALGAPLTVCVGHSGIASSTKTMVDAVAQLRAKKPDVAEKTFDGIRALVRNARLAIEAGDRFALGRLMDLNQMLLAGLFLSTPEIEHMCGLARDRGAYGAKLTGAGGGGCVVALVNGDAGAARVIEAWKSAGFEGFATRVASLEPLPTAVGESA
jgi:mevalonate kinase